MEKLNIINGVQMCDGLETPEDPRYSVAPLHDRADCLVYWHKDFSGQPGSAYLCASCYFVASELLWHELTVHSLI